jgi:hypothetical protein
MSWMPLGIVGGMFTLRPTGVYTAQGDTFLLISALRREGLAPGSRVLDVGTGTVALAVAAAGDNFARACPAPLGGLISIGLLHTCLDGQRVHARTS